jgi:CubicO group peptidase (beta-lactamase class C family)
MMNLLEHKKIKCSLLGLVFLSGVLVLKLWGINGSKTFSWLNHGEFAVASAHQPESQSAKIRQIVNKQHLWGTLLYTSDSGHKLHYQTFGYANQATGKKNGINELYPIASLQKGYTGSLIQMLINQHLLTMNTKLAQFYPQIPYAKKITIRELLDHTSGIQMGEPVPSTKLVSQSQAINWTLKHLKSTGKFNWNYSNANYTLLAGIISQVTQRPYYEVLQAEILQPLHLSQTVTWQTASQKFTGQAYFNNQTRVYPVSQPLLSSEFGCGNLYTDVTDYYYFVNALQSQRLFKQQAYDQLTQDHTSYSGGFYYQKNFQRADGADNHYFSFYYGTKNNKITVIFFANRSPSDYAGRVAVKEIANLLAAPPKS